MRQVGPVRANAAVGSGAGAGVRELRDRCGSCRRCGRMSGFPGAGGPSWPSITLCCPVPMLSNMAAVHVHRRGPDTAGAPRQVVSRGAGVAANECK